MYGKNVHDDLFDALSYEQEKAKLTKVVDVPKLQTENNYLKEIVALQKKLIKQLEEKDKRY